MDLKERVKVLLKARGITQAELAEKIGVQGGTLSNAISGRYSPTLDTLERIAEALGVSVAELFAELPHCPYCGMPLGITASKTEKPHK